MSTLLQDILGVEISKKNTTTDNLDHYEHIYNVYKNTITGNQDHWTYIQYV